MKFLLAILRITSLLVVSVGFPMAFSDQFVLEANPTSLSYSIHQNPAISGQITNSNGDPLSDIYVYALFSSEKAADMTDRNGKFFLRSPEKYSQGEHSVEVYARDGPSLYRTVISFEVYEPEILQISPSLQPAKNDDSLSIAEMLKQAKSFQQEEQQPVIHSQDNTTKFVEEQRQFAQQSLEDDIAENSHEVQKEENKNSFASFVSTLDSLMHQIFWDQFYFTQNISEEAYEAKTSALGEGRTSLEATKIYQDTAAVTKKEVIDYMEELNVKHGFANATVQERFDENGKLPRNQQTEEQPSQ